MLNSSGTESKHCASIALTGATGVIGSEEFPIFAETKLRVQLVSVGATNALQVQGRIKTSSVWTTLKTIVGATEDIIDISTYDFVRYSVSVADGTGMMYSSGFFLPSTVISYNPTNWSYAAPAAGIANTTTAVTIVAAPGSALLRNYITGIQFTWVGGTASELVVRDGAGGAGIFRVRLPTTEGIYSFIFSTPIKQPTLNTLLEVVTLTATGATGFVHFNAQGYVGA